MELQSHRFIAAFESDQAQELSQLCVVETLPEGTVIFEEGEIPDYLYLVLSGQVEFRKHKGSGDYQTIALAKPNDFFGEFGIIDGQPRSAQAIVAQTAALGRIPRDRLMDILHHTKGVVVLKLFQFIVQHLRATTAQYVNQMVHQEKMSLIGEMVNTIIHDFKSPVTGIQLASSMLKEMHPDEETVEWCELIQAQVKRMLAMTEELLEFARGSTLLTQKPINVAELLEQFIKLNRVYLENAQVELVVQSENAIIEADELKLMRVWQNLVGNAVEAFQGQGGRIAITIQKQRHHAVITLEDNGPGIPESIRSRLFDPFVTHGKRGGTGLGTAIVKSIVDAHNGDIHFQSELGKGTIFYIHLPLAQTSTYSPLTPHLEEVY